MPVVTIACPRTGKSVSMGMELEPSEFDTLGPKIFRIRCSACGSEHLWSRGTAWLTETPKKPAANKPEDIDLLKEVRAVTKRHSTREGAIDDPRRKRIADIIDRLLEINDASPGTSPDRNTRK
jgi:hypothetical protein